MTDAADPTPDFAVVAQGNLDHLQEIQRALRAREVHSEVVQPPEGMGSPDGSVLLLAVSNEDAQIAAQIVYELWGRGLDPEAAAIASRTIDLDASEASCPACGTNFTPADLRCPECGLRIG
jgi:DNA-directed RNA polymerase subunit RPC12/RpoP